jgi:uncharacterized protein with HEPN domain
MPRDYKAYLEDIVQAAQKINRYVSGLSVQTFSDDEKTIDAVVRNLEVIREAVRNIPEDIRDKYSKIAWRRIAGLRNILIHEYFAISTKIIWDISTNKLPILEQQIKKILED